MNRVPNPAFKRRRRAIRSRRPETHPLAAALGAAMFLLAAATAARAAAPEGIPRGLARERAAQISNVRYHLTFTLVPHAGTTAGSEELNFTLRTAQPVLLDFREGAISSLDVNGAPAAALADHGHLELPGGRLRAGENTVRVQFAARVAPAGEPITRYEDHDDGAEYIYTLFVPMDASMAFPCFDQPDLKARFRLDLIAPAGWAAISNTAAESESEAGPEQRRTAFRETLPISTYLFAFAAGPFRRVGEAPGLPGLYVRQSRLKQAEDEAPEVQQIAAQGIKYLSDYFARPFPFPKYDMVLIPELAYGGMEHAGATFLREQSVLFRAAPTHTDRLNRDILVVHELTHQWFGDLVTMRWFDDLWLKEGFAQYMAYQTLASLKPDENVWQRFYLSIKPAAYEIDSTQGTTPIYQDIPNLKDAKSAYGAIVYSKAPAVLKQLAYVLGPENFRGGLRLYLKDHAYSNAEWSDLVHALEKVSGRNLARWAEMWIRHRGMPQVDVAWSCEGGRVSRLAVAQHDVLGTGDTWPIATQILLDEAKGQPIHLRVELDQPTMAVPEAAGRPCPNFVFANDQDFAYGRFLLDPASRSSVVSGLGGEHDLFRRTLLWGSLWDAVREAELAPRDYLALARRLLPTETDQPLTQTLLAHTATALHRYVSADARGEFVPALERMAADRMAGDSDQDLRITWFRGLRALAETPQGLGKLEEVLNGQLSVPGVQLRPLDRWSLVTSLIALGDARSQANFEAERRRDPGGDGPEYAYAAEAARPDRATKRKYFDDYLHNSSRPEDWIAQSLGAFNYWNQSALTEPYLKPALEALPEIKRNRKIFFLMAWLGAFVDGQQSAAAQAEVHRYLRTAPLDRDLQLKILQAVDELDRTVKIRRRYPD
ncbi:MAG TPA: M1 family aminopeptidase [Terriglobia bacterium]|nr:M1 family aminopeptidase [Terriglobia bacterium]